MTQRVTTSDNELQGMGVNDNEWQRMIISTNLPFISNNMVLVLVPSQGNFEKWILLFK